MSKQTDAVNEDPELVISVSANDAYTEEERNQLAKGFGDTFGTIAQSYSYFEASGDSPPIVIFSLGLLGSGGVLGGFLNAMGRICGRHSNPSWRYNFKTRARR